MARVILFDIDGTLLFTGGAGSRAMTRAFEELFGVADALRGIPLAGRTDAWLVDSLATKHGVRGAPQLARFRDTYLAHLAMELPKPGPRKGLMPGIRALLDLLAARPEVHLALLTGNYRRGARVKLEYFDLWRYFRGGAFGDEALDRHALVRAALDSVEACGGPSASCADAVVVGDTPLDVACAARAGARSMAVATGEFDAEALRRAGADVVFEDFSQTAAVIAELDRLA